VQNGITLRGANRDGCLLYSAPTAGYVITLSGGATIEHFTLGNADGLASIGIYAADTGTIRDVRINDAFSNSAIRLDGASCTVLVEDCEIANMPAGHTERGFEIVFGAHPIVRNCLVSGWGYGIFVNTTSDPLIEGCTITDNVDGVIVFQAASNPDLGGGLRESGGGNTIQGNLEFGVYNSATGTISAFYNTWNQWPPLVSATPPADIYNEAGGSVAWQ
jgi:parallel beta-helix repeat protein